MAAALGGVPRLRGQRRSFPSEVLLARHVRVPVRACPHGPRAQLHDRGRGGAHEADARLQRALPVWLGRLRPARRERRDQGRDPSGSVHARQHRAHEGTAAAARDQLRVGTGAGDVRSRVLQVEPVALHPNVRARSGVPQALIGQLVLELQHRPRQRAGGRGWLLALRHPGRDARPRAVVLPHHRVRRRTAGTPPLA